MGGKLQAANSEKKIVSKVLSRNWQKENYSRKSENDVLFEIPLCEDDGKKNSVGIIFVD